MGLLDQIKSYAGTANNFVNGAVNNPLFNVGLGLMAGGTGLNNPGDEVQKALANYQQRQLQQQQYGMNQLQMARTAALLRESGLLGPDQAGAAAPPAQGASPPPAAPVGAPAPSALPSGPQATPGGAAAPAQPNQNQPWWLQPITAQTIGQTQLPGGFTPRSAEAMALLSGKDPVAASSAVYQQQLKLAQQKYAPVIGLLDTVRQADHPQQLLNANPELRAAWPQIAAAAGVDPAKATDQQIRTALAAERNQLASGLTEATVAPPVPLQTIPGGIGGGPLAQVNPVTGEYKPVAQQETANFIGKDGQIHMMPKAQGIAQGLTPYTPQTYINTGTTSGMADLIASYRAPPLSGFALRSPQGQAIMAQVLQENPQYDATQYGAKNKAREAFATGKQGDTVRSLSVATNHLDTLGHMVDALGNGNLRVFNSLANTWAQETGAAAPTNFDTIKNIVADEVVKAVVGSGGAQSDREAAAAKISRANSPAQLRGAIQSYEKLMGGQLDGLRRQYEHSTGLKDFDSMLSDQAKTQLGAPSEAAAPAAGGLPPDVRALVEKYASAGR